MSVLETKEEGSINIELYSQAIEQANYYVMSQWIGGRKRRIKRIELKTSRQGTIILEDIKARRQFLHHLGLGLREVEAVKDYHERSDMVKEALEQRAFEELTEKRLPLVFRCHIDDYGYKAWSVVTTDYVEVPTQEVVKFFESMLTSRGLGSSKMTKQWDDGKAVYRVYDLWDSPTEPRQVGDLASCGVVLRAGYSGDRSVGLLGFYTILACTNGMMSNRQVTAFRGIHRGVEKQEILNQLDKAFDVIEAELPMIEEMVEQAKEPIDEEEEKRLLDKILADYPQHIRKKVIEYAEKKYRTETGVFKLSQAISDVASHYAGTTENYQRQLSQDAYKILVTTPKKKKEKN